MWSTENLSDKQNRVDMLLFVQSFSCSLCVIKQHLTTESVLNIKKVLLPSIAIFQS